MNINGVIAIVVQAYSEMLGLSPYRRPGQGTLPKATSTIPLLYGYLFSANMANGKQGKLSHIPHVLAPNIPYPTIFSSTHQGKAIHLQIT